MCVRACVRAHARVCACVRMCAQLYMFQFILFLTVDFNDKIN